VNPSLSAMLESDDFGPCHQADPQTGPYARSVEEAAMSKYPPQLAERCLVGQGGEVADPPDVLFRRRRALAADAFREPFEVRHEHP
jgi:hypothetical protein